MKSYRVLSELSELSELETYLKSCEYVAFDTETTGLNPRKDKVIGFSVTGIEGTGYYVPFYNFNVDSAELESLEFLDSCQTVFELLLTKKLIMHNASFDCRMMRANFNLNLIPALYCDTIVLKHTVDEDMPFGLKDIAKRIQNEIGLDVTKAANEEQVAMVASIKQNGGSITKDKYELYKADLKLIGEYACADTDLTLRIFNYYSTILKREGLERFFYKDEVMPLLKEVTIPMEERGVPVDVSALQCAQEEIILDIAKLEKNILDKISPYLPDFERWYLGKNYPPRRSGEFAQKLAEYARLPLPKTKSGRLSLSKSALESCLPNKYAEYLLGGEYLDDHEVLAVSKLCWQDSGSPAIINLLSKHHLKRLFFKILNEKSINKTPTGQPQADTVFLESVRSKYDFVPLLMDFNKLNKLKSAYIDRFLSEQDSGIFYPRFQQHRTVSGRYGGDLMQLPRPLEPGQASEVVTKYTNMIRKFFISGSGYKFIDADYESLEPHVFAHVSGDEGLKDIFRSGKDFYSSIAIATENLNGVSADKKSDNYLGKVDKPLRQKAKAYCLGVPYGLEAFKLSTMLNNSPEECEELIDNYLSAYPKLKSWMEVSNEQCKKFGTVRSEAGRVRHMKKAAAFYHQDRGIYALFDSKGNLYDALTLWKKHHKNESSYKNMKWKRKQMKNYLNNAKNFQIQSLAASITNRACIAISRELRRQGIDGYVCCQIHDQIIVRLPEQESVRFSKTMQYLMENVYKISLPLSAPAQIASDFYEGH